MPAINPIKKITASTRSVFFRLTLIVAICTAIVAGTLIVMSYVGSRNVSELSVKTKALEVTSFAAEQSASSIRFANVQALETIMGGAIDSSNNSAMYGAIFNKKGEAILSDGENVALNDALSALAATAMETGEVAVSTDGYFVAAPARFGSKNEVIGVVAMAWTAEHVLADNIENQMQVVGYGIAVFFAAMIAVTFVLRSSMSVPLVRVGAAMNRVAGADYNFVVPSLKRGDEIGDIARTLDDFRGSLQEAEATSIDSMYKGAAFEASSAAMMMVDQNLTINYINEAFRDLLRENEPFLKTYLKEFSVDQMVGKNIEYFHGANSRANEIVADPANLPHHTDIALGKTRMEQTISAIHSPDGTLVGRVFQWKDVTIERLNSAILRTLDESQILLEFTPEGVLSKANERFCDAVGMSANDVVGQDGPVMFPANEFDDGTEVGLWDRLRGGDNVHGRFKTPTSSGGTIILDGGFSVVVGQGGNVANIVMLANDVTAAQEEMAVADTKRAEMQKQQSAVVDGLRVGLNSLSQGDLTTTIDQKFADEYEALRVDFNKAVGALRNAMSSVVDNSESIRGEASDISKAADDLSRRTETQAATLEETAASLDEMTSSVTSAAEGAGQARKMVSEARDNAEKSGEVVREAVSAMSEIENSSQQISKITSVIDDIAFQTNLLSLNAGVEAARAGDAGRGFAVVATEVRDLAQRSSNAAREINALISASGDQVKRGVSLVGQTGDALREIFDHVSSIAEKVGEIAVSAEEQSRGLEEINLAVNQLDQVTQQNAAMFEETTAASHALTSEAVNLSQTMQQFSTGTSSKPAKSEAPAPAAARPAAKPVAKPAAPTPPPVKQVANGTPVAAEPLDETWEDF